MKYDTTLFPNQLIIVLACLLLAACGGQGNTNSTTSTDSTMRPLPQTDAVTRVALVPGRSAGPFKIGGADSVVHRELGRPDHSDAAMGKAVLIWYTDSVKRYPLSVFTARDMGNDETARIQQIRVTSPTFETADSVHVGSTLADIRNAYQVTAVETYDQAGETCTVYDAEEGIAFEVGPDERCVAIIIHPPGAGKASYLPLRPGD